MAANEIKIIIGGNAKGIQSAAVQTNTALQSISAASNQINKSFATIVPGAKNAGAAVLDFSRVVQDAPYALNNFGSIANNIDPLFASFRRLTQETGSLKGAFQALGSSLLGGAGLGLAISLVTSALTVFSMSAGGAKEKLEGYAKAIDEANKKAGEELARVTVLNAVLTDATRSQDERTRAAGELSDTLDDLNIKMSKEEILNGNVAKATQLATAAIIERAKARAAEARIAELSSQNLDRESKRIKVLEDLTKAQKTLSAAQAANAGVVGGGSAPGIRGNTIGAQNAVVSLQKEISNLNNATAEANIEMERLVGLIKTNDFNVDLGGGDKGKKDLDLLKQRIDALKKLQELTGLTGAQQVELAQLEIKLAERDAVKIGFTPAELQQEIEGILEKAFPVATFEFDLQARPKINLEEINTNIDVAGATGLETIEIPAPEFRFTNLKNSADEARKQVGDTLFGALVQGIEESSALVGEALAGIFSGEGVSSSLAKAAQGMLGIVGTILQQVGKQIIVTSQLVARLKAALDKLFGPGGEALGFAVGAALIATGALLKNIKFDIPKLADGGIASRATLGIFGEAGKEAIIPLDKLPQMMGKMNFANQQPVILQPSIRFSLTEFQLGLERVDNQRRRLG